VAKRSTDILRFARLAARFGFECKPESESARQNAERSFVSAKTNGAEKRGRKPARCEPSVLACEASSEPDARRAAGASLKHCSADAVRAAIAALQQPNAYPSPIAGHGCKPRECSTDAAPWSSAEYLQAVAACEEVANEAESDEAMGERMATCMLEHPSSPEWQRAADECVRAFVEKQERRGAVESAGRTRALERAEFIRTGGDPTSSEWIDRLSLRGQAAYWRRHGNIARARDLERRARQSSGLRR